MRKEGQKIVLSAGRESRESHPRATRRRDGRPPPAPVHPTGAPGSGRSPVAPANGPPSEPSALMVRQLLKVPMSHWMRAPVPGL
jgi:hypothetical protein